MGSCPDAVKQLVEHFDHQLDQVCSPEYNDVTDAETQIEESTE